MSNVWKNTVQTSEKSEGFLIYKEFLETNQEQISALLSDYQEKRNVLNYLNQNLLKLDLDLFEQEKLINKTKKTLTNILEKPLNFNLNINNELEKIVQIKDHIGNLNLKKEKINDDIEKINDEMLSISNNLKILEKEWESFSYGIILNSFKESSSELKLKDLLIDNDDLKNLVESYKSQKIPKELLNNVILFKWKSNTGKHSAIKAMGNELNRPIFTIKYEDYFNQEWLSYIFSVLTTFLRDQRDMKNSQIEWRDILFNNLNQIRKLEKNNDNWPYDLSIINNEWENIFIIVDSKQWAQEFIEKIPELEENLTIIDNNIDSINDSCILCIDDLDKIINFSKHEKWNLLAPIKHVINNIKDEDHNIILVLVGDELGNNDNDFKSWINKVISFDWIETNYKELFNKILNNYKEKYWIQFDFNSIELPDISKKHQNVKFLDNLAKSIVKKVFTINDKKSYDKEHLDLENIIWKQEKEYDSLYSGVGFWSV